MRRAGRIAALTGAAAAAFAAGEVYRYIFCRNSGIIGRLHEPRGHKEDYYLHRDGDAARLRRCRCIRLELTNDRSDTLEGYYYPCSGAPCGRIAFIVHGYRSEHLETACMYYDYYMSRGFDLFTCDLTAAGESGGRRYGYDIFESRDVKLWLDVLLKRFGGDIQIILHGFSMGGATVLKVSDSCPEQVKFIVSDSGFTSGAEILRGRIGAAYPLFRLLNRVISGYDMDDTDVRENLRRTDKPVLFFHGTEDRTVPFHMGEELYELCPTEKDCLFVPGARHVESMHVDPEGYAEKLDGFIKRYIK